ncbi:AEC family transporter [Candidatus Eisenbacteria bacterium]|uniref:AEC family transporter n=1 Tax=Eiseniibacteriota bacterium TaxID=2212470 RepID=A0ABV6YIH3_UNCEI
MSLLNIVLPVFLVIGLAYGLRRSGFLQISWTAGLSRLVFYVAAPALLFQSTAQHSFDWGVSIPTLLVVAGIAVVVGLGVYGVARNLPPERRGVLAQGASRSNTVFVGLPLVLNAFGETALARASVVIAFMVVVDNLLSVCLLTLPHEQHSGRKPGLGWHTTLQILRNPLILGCGGGILYSSLGLELPVSLDRALALIGRTAAPLGLVCVGAGLQLRSLRPELPGVAVTAAVRLVFHPLLTYIGLRLIGVEGLDLGVPVLLMACPTAIVSYIMAREMGGDAQFGAAIVIGTTVLSFLTLIGWIALLRLA